VVQDLSENIGGHCDVEVLVCQPRGRMTRDVVNGVNVTRAGSLGIWLSMPVSLSYPLLLRDWARRVDLIHLHHPFPLGELSALLFNSSRRMVFTWHSAILRRKMLAKLYRPFLGRLLDRVAAIILTYPGAHLQSELLVQRSSKCLVIPPGIEPRDYELDETRRRTAEMIRARRGENLVLFVGRLVYYKGLQHLIAAMPAVRGRLLIVGNGPLRSRLEKQAAKLGVSDRVCFLGELDDGQLKATFHACDVFVLPSVHPAEAFGIVQLEAMVCGKPVVNTRLQTGVPLVSLDGITGLTVEPANPGALANALNTLLADPDLRRVYGENGRKRVQQEFTVQFMAERMLQLYKKVLAS
jgi:glycosyltransferase involved in cell wall biosynthesis